MIFGARGSHKFWWCLCGIWRVSECYMILTRCECNNILMHRTKEETCWLISRQKVNYATAVQLVCNMRGCLYSLIFRCERRQKNGNLLKRQTMLVNLQCSETKGQSVIYSKRQAFHFEMPVRERAKVITWNFLFSRSLIKILSARLKGSDTGLHFSYCYGFFLLCHLMVSSH